MLSLWRGEKLRARVPSDLGIQDFLYRCRLLLGGKSAGRIFPSLLRGLAPFEREPTLLDVLLVYKVERSRLP